MKKQAQKKKQWSNRSIAKAWQYGFFHVLIRIGGQVLPNLFLYLLIAYYTLFRPLVRRRVSHYLKRRFPDAGPIEYLTHIYRHCLHFGRVLISRAAIGSLGRERFKATLHHKEKLLEVLGRDTGVILMTAHVGSWQLGLTTLDFIDKPIALLLEQEMGKALGHMHDKDLGQQQFEYIDPAGPFGGTLEILQRLRAGGLVSVMGDRVYGSERSIVTAPFLGGTAEFPLSPYFLASAAEAPIVVLLSRKTGMYSFELDVVDVMDIPTGLGRDATAYAPYARRFARLLEEYTDKTPYQFFNFHDMWQPHKKDTNG